MIENTMLSRVERLSLYNQYLILEKLDPEQAEYYTRAQEILRNGFEGEYSSFFSGFEELSADKCAQVHDILEMYDSFEFRKKNGVTIPSEAQWLFEFEGFDGNNESDYLAYAQFLVGQRYRYDLLKPKAQNAHRSTLSKHERLLDLWREIPQEKRFQLTAEDFSLLHSQWNP